MTIGDIMCIKSSIKSILKKIKEKDVSADIKLEYTKKELEAVERLIDSSIKQ